MSNPLEKRVTREICRLCHHVNAVGFSVPDSVWRAVVPPAHRRKVLCVGCFIHLADEKCLQWDLAIEFHPVSLATHLLAK